MQVLRAKRLSPRQKRTGATAHLGLFLMCTRCLALQDFFFRCYADAVAQAVLYAMFLAYPKSRIDFTEKFRKDRNQWRFLGTVKV